MLGDGSIRYNNMSRNKEARGNCRYTMTMDASSYDYMSFLVEGVYAPYCLSGLNAYPKPSSPNYAGSVTQYNFSTKYLPVFTVLHEIWYRVDPTSGKYVKIVPLNVGEMFSPVSLAHWLVF